jgi:hypothetical protein
MTRSANARLAPRLPLPPYRYVPGRAPHPLRHVGGHLRGDDRPRPANRDEAFRYALDLFHHDFPWEAHEVLEELWRGEAPRSLERRILQGMIQVAAAQLKFEIGAREIGERLLAAVTARIAHDRHDAAYRGIAVRDVIAAVAAVRDGKPPSFDPDRG